MNSGGVVLRRRCACCCLAGTTLSTTLSTWNLCRGLLRWLGWLYRQSRCVSYNSYLGCHDVDSLSARGRSYALASVSRRPHSIRIRLALQLWLPDRLWLGSKELPWGSNVDNMVQ